MKTFQIIQNGKVNDAVCVYQVTADTEQEAVDKFQKGDVFESEIIDGDFESDDGDFEIEEVGK